jgi:sulfur carrier protein ThiS
MKVTLKLSGGFVHTVGFSRKEVEVEPGTTIGDLLATIAIDRTRPMLIARNGWVVPVEERLEDGDRILISPVFSGG